MIAFMNNKPSVLTAVPHNCHAIVLNDVILLFTWIRAVYEHEIQEMQSCHPILVMCPASC